MSKEVSETGPAGSPVTQATHLSSEPFVQEFLHLVDEGWEPDLTEFVERVPEPIREEVFERLDEALEQRTVKDWDESGELEDDDVLNQSVLGESSEAILAAAMGESQEPPSTDHVTADEFQAPKVIPLAEPYELEQERFAPPAPEPEPEPEEALELDEEPESMVDVALPEAEAEPEPVHEESSYDAAPPEYHGTFVAGYDLRQDMGRGTLGQTYLAIDGSGNQRVLKIAGSDVPAKVLERLYREAAKVKALRVDQLVAIEETKHEATGAITIAPYVQGDPIDIAVMDLELEDRVRYLQMVIEALASAHAGGLLHLDLKPSNVLVTSTGDVRLLDCGVGVAVLAVPERMANLAGAGHYASPEHARRGRVTTASDIFSFGSLMYRVLTRKLPFPGGAPDLIRERIEAAEPMAPRLHDASIPPALQDICLACLSRNPSDRPDAGTLIASFDRYFVGRPVRLRPAVYRGILRRETRDVLAQADAWRNQGFSRPAESDRLEGVCRRILAREEHWTYDRHNAPRARTIAWIGAMFFALGATLIAHFGYAHVSMLGAFFPIVGIGALLIAGVRARRGGEAAMADALVGGALVALTPALVTLLQRTAFLDGAGPYAGLSWLQLAAATGATALGALGALYRFRQEVYAWIACGAIVLAWCASVGVVGLQSFGALALVPLALLLWVAQQFEAHDRFNWMRPFLVAGFGALTAAPLYAASTGAISLLPGIEVAAVGLLWATLAPILARSSSLVLRASARWLAALAPGAALGGLAWHATATGDLTAWLGVFGIGILLGAHGAVFRNRGTLAWGVLAMMGAALVPALRGLATPWTFSIVVAAAGLVAAVAVGFASGRTRSP